MMPGEAERTVADTPGSAPFSSTFFLASYTIKSKKQNAQFPSVSAAMNSQKTWSRPMRQKQTFTAVEVAFWESFCFPYNRQKYDW